MTGQQTRGPGRPPKTDNRAFQLLALAGYARHLSQAATAALINDALQPHSVTQPTVGKWLDRDRAAVAVPTVAIQRPDALGLRIVCLLFQRKPAYALKLIALLSKEPLVTRVEHWRGEMNVFAEIASHSSADIDDLVERYEPDVLYEVVERTDRLPAVLEHLGREL